MACIAASRQHGELLAADSVVGVLGEPVGGGEQAGQRILGRRGGGAGDTVPASMPSSSSSTVGSASAATNTVAPSQRWAMPASTSAAVNVVRSSSGHSSSPYSTAVSSVAEDDRERAELLVEAGEQGVGAGLELLGHDQLVAGPRVGDVLVGERCRQLGALFEVPRRDVVVHLDCVRIVGVPIEHVGDANGTCLRFGHDDDALVPIATWRWSSSASPRRPPWLPPLDRAG